jgi:hypothetical protein
MAAFFGMGERRLRCRSAPDLYPGQAVGLELGNNVGRDFVVEARPAKLALADMLDFWRLLADNATRS